VDSRNCFDPYFFLSSVCLLTLICIPSSEFPEPVSDACKWVSQLGESEIQVSKSEKKTSVFIPTLLLSCWQSNLISLRYLWNGVNRVFENHEWICVIFLAECLNLLGHFLINIICLVTLVNQLL
jgi:hypothetical protein